MIDVTPERWSRPDAEAFDLSGALPCGRLAIEASAGTGKTFALATLAARYVAERDVPVGAVLVVTFTRAAAAELKDRVRRRLVEFASALSAPDEPDDPLLSALRSTERYVRLGRVRRAVAQFDSATITTIHGFAQQVLATLGVAVPTDPDAVLADDAGRAVRQVAADLLVSEALGGPQPAGELPGLEALSKTAAVVMGNPAATLVPGPDDSNPEAARVRRLVDAVTGEVVARRRQAGTVAFEDLLVRLSDAVFGETAGAVRHLLRRRYSVALIDEFQDTDPLQWSIFDAVFGVEAAGRDPRTDLVVVGDPKQAIYGFRGANVHTYLQAVHEERMTRAHLSVNWRSDSRALQATELLLSGVTFGDERIGFQAVTPAEAKAAAYPSAGGGPLPALSVRLMDGPGVPRQKKSQAVALDGPGTRAVLADMACHIRDLLEDVDIPDPDGRAGRRRLRPGDVAVLVTTNREAPQARDALRKVGIPAVVARGESVLLSPAATQWHLLLAGVARPSDPRRARAFTLSWFAGWDAARLAAAGDTDLAAVHEQLHGWAEYLGVHGPAAFVGRVRYETGVVERVLQRSDGERDMTDLDHVGELLVHAGGIRTTPAALLDAFESLEVDDASGDVETDLAARRVESDSDAVQIMTTFVSKGLEFPVVCCPTLWKPGATKTAAHVWWDEAASTRVIDVAPHVKWGGDDEARRRRQIAETEDLGAKLRLLYVALTRARHHTALWWLPVAKAGSTSLGRVLFARDGDATINPSLLADPAGVPLGDATAAKLAPLVERGDGCIEVVSVDKPARAQRPWSKEAPCAQTPLGVAELRRSVDREARRWSFTAITAARSGASHADSNISIASELDPPLVEGAGGYDEGFEGQYVNAGAVSSDPPHAGAGPGGSRMAETPLALGKAPGSAAFGTLIHEILERVDFASVDLAGAIERVVHERIRWATVDAEPAALVEGLAAVLSTPLGPLFDGACLAHLRRADRIDEMTFDLTLAGAGRRATDAEVGRLIADHLAAGDPLRSWALSLGRGPHPTVLAGHLTGSIDLVARVRGPKGAERYVVCDYKTNRLAPPGRPALPEDFTPDRLVLAMQAHDYPLQGLLYTVALHRYLRWRVRGYDPSAHLGGIGYLFVRGMQGSETPTTSGVPNGLFDWRPPAGLVVALSDLLDGADPTSLAPR